jgi:uncharacterized protein YgiM (DUF1202 family)
MCRKHRVIIPCTLLLLLSLTFGACKSKEEQSKPDDLPDLTHQSRPYVTVENTTVRTGPGDQFRPISKIPSNAKVHVVARDGDWLLIVSKKGNAPGFIPMTSAEPGEGEEQPEDTQRKVERSYETLVNTQLRAGPGLHYPAVADIAKGTKIHVVEEVKGWLKVESKQGRKPGYIEGSVARPAGTRQ